MSNDEFKEMFVTEEWNVIDGLIEHQRFPERVKILFQNQEKNIEQALSHAKILREFSTNHIQYIIQTAIQAEQSNLAFLFSPFILASLNHSVIYHTQGTAPVFDILNRYYNAEQQKTLKVDNALDAIRLYLDLSVYELNDVEFLYFSLIQALCKSDVTQIFLITHLSIDAKKIDEIEKIFKVKIYFIYSDPSNKFKNSTELNMRKLLFKNKDQPHIELCEQFAQLNSKLLVSNKQYSQKQAVNLIEDMFYAEHIYEKLSVYAEYIQTCMQHQTSQ